MTRSYAFEAPSGLRRFDDGDFPLAIGGEGADIPLAGLNGAGPLAYLGLSEGDLFVQVTENGADVAINGTRVQSSNWLHNGDLLYVGSARLSIEEGSDGETRFIPREGGDAQVVLEPPPREDREASGIKVRPIVFEPAANFGAEKRRSLSATHVILGLFLISLLGVAAFVFTSRSILVEIEPPPDRVTIEGGFAFKMGGRHLLRPGSYILSAEKAGYRPLTSPFEVTRETAQTFRFALEQLPGLLAVSTPSVAGAEIFIDGERLATTPLDGALEVPSGVHEIRIVAERYREHRAEIEIEGGGVTQTLLAELEPLWAPVTFRSEPPGAAVRVAGTRAGRTPLTAEVEEGARTYELILAGYKPHRGRLQVVAGEPLAVPEVRLVPSDGNVALLSEPDGATVAVDGVFRGTTPLDLKLEPGRSHLLKVSKVGYAPSTHEIEVRSEETRDLVVELEALEGELRIVSWPADAELLVDGTSHGRASQTLRLKAVAHEVVVKKAGFVPFRTTITPIPDLPQSVEVTLEKVEEVKVDRTPEILTSSEGHELRRIEPGRFLMGASRREPGRRANETLREVELTRAFYLGTQEVTNAQFRRFKEDHLSGHISSRTLDIEDHPVVRVTWEDAARYCNYLSAREGLPQAYVKRDGKLVLSGPQTTGYRLPSEAEWAWAARFDASSGATKFPWGPALPVPSGSGNFADRSAQEILPGAMSDYNDQYPVTAPVSSFPPNARGLYNMGGNVAEWVNDYYSIRPAGTSKVARDPFGPEEGDFHVIRGSSWMHSTVTELRLTFRDYSDQERPDVGFRIARYLE